MIFSHTTLYADDTAISVSSPNINVLKLKLQCELNQAAIWFRQNKLSLNLKETKIMFFGTNHTLTGTENINLEFENEHVETITKFKYLGVQLDSRLTWSNHIE